MLLFYFNQFKRRMKKNVYLDESGDLGFNFEKPYP